MKPALKKQFILESFAYNLSLAEPFECVYHIPQEYYHKTNYLKFIKKYSITTGQIDLSKKDNSYFTSLVEKDIDNETTPHSRKLVLVGDDDFIFPYFKHFFIKHPDLQLDLMKFFNGFLSYKIKQIEFLSNFEKKEVEPFLTNVNHWLSFSNEELNNLNVFMSAKNFNEGFKVSIIKKYVEYNLKAINKTPSLSKGLEDFISLNYPQHLDIIAPNVSAIQNRKKDINEQDYFSCFAENICLNETINTEKLLKTFQIPGWTNNSYNSLIQLYNLHLTTTKKFTIKEHLHQNNKEIEIFIKMPENNFTLDSYKKTLLVLHSFYRSNPEQKLTVEMVGKIIFNHKINEALPATNKKTPHKKI